MSQPNKYAALKREWDSLFRRIIEAAEKEGSERGRKRVLTVLQEEFDLEVMSKVDEEASSQRLPYGAAKNAVRRALAAHPAGIAKPDIHTWVYEHVDILLKMDSITEALKSLARNHEADNPERGKWIPGPDLDREKLGAATPSNFNTHN